MGIFKIVTIVRAIFTWRALFVLILSMAVLVPAVGVSYSQAPDVTPPVSMIVLTGTAGWAEWFTSNVTVTLEATDDLSGVSSIRYSLDDGENWTGYDCSFNITEEGMTTVLYRAIDNVGNREEVRRQDVYIDRTSPEINCTLEDTIINGWYADRATIRLDTYDNVSGIEHVFYGINESVRIPYDGPFTISDDYPVTLYYNTSDKAGNGNGSNVTFKVDAESPVSWHEIHGIAGGDGWYVSNVVILLNGSDNGSGLAYIESRQNGGEWERYTTGQVFDGDRIVHYEYRAVDNVGHVGETHCLDFKIDLTAPVTTYTLAGTESMPGWYVSNVTVTLAGDDGTSGVALTEYSFDNVSWATYEGSFIVSGQGLKSVYYRSSDAAGNVETVRNATFVIDTMPPIVMGTVPADGTRAASLDCLIRIAFSEPMDNTTFGPGSIVVKDWYGFIVQGNISYAGLTATFDPAQNLGPDFRYYIIVSKDVRDISGNSMGIDYSWSFKTAGVPQIPGTFVPSNVTPSATPTPTPVPTPTPSPSPSPTVVPSPTITPSPTPEPTTIPSAMPEPSQNNSSPVYLGLLILFLGIVALSGAAIYFVMFKKF